jgi:hypothetical protein
MTRIANLETMDREALLALWAATLGGEAPARLSRPFLRRILAFELQARAQGGLPASVKRKLESLAAAQAGGHRGQPQKATSPKLKPGGRLLREWNGTTHVVDVVEGGFLWRGERHRSLSAIARAITGAHWSGPRFFGLQEGAGTAGVKKGARRDKATRLPRANGGASSDKATTPSRGRRAA